MKYKIKVSYILQIVILVLIFSCRANDREQLFSFSGATASVKINLLGSDYQNSQINIKENTAFLEDEKIEVLSPSSFISFRESYEPRKSVADVLASNIMFRVLVYNSNYDYITSRDYIVGALPTSLPLMLDGDSVYNIVVYSYNTKFLPILSSIEQGNLANAQVSYDNNNPDFMYYQTLFIPSGGSNNLNIILRHKLSNVTINIKDNTNMGFSIINRVSLTGHYTKGFFSLSNGNASVKDSPSLRNFVFDAAQFSPTAINAKSNTLFMNTGAAALVNFAGNIVINGIAKQLSFNGLFTIKPGFKQIFSLNYTNCGVYLGSNYTNWKNMMCYNLGSNPSVNSLIPNQFLNGAKYQWGNMNPIKTQTQDLLNYLDDSPWNTIPASNDSWSDIIKTANDPCPTGYRVPTIDQWNAIISNYSNPNKNTTIEKVGAWLNDETFSTVIYFRDALNGRTLMLPTAGYRDYTDGRLYVRGAYGYYWSSSYTNSQAHSLYFTNTGLMSGAYFVTSGFSVRCIEE
ncbi:TPA: FISUMP domain-containing protein [Elizabethkingia anophelis]